MQLQNGPQSQVAAGSKSRAVFLVGCLELRFCAVLEDAYRLITSTFIHCEDQVWPRQKLLSSWGIVPEMLTTLLVRLAPL